jgi:hypothetical protein
MVPTQKLRTQWKTDSLPYGKATRQLEDRLCCFDWYLSPFCHILFFSFACNLVFCNQLSANAWYTSKQFGSQSPSPVWGCIVERR